MSFPRMPLFSPYVGIVTRASPSGRSPVEELYFKWMVAAAVFFVALQIAYLTFAGLPPIGKPWVDATNFVYGRDFLNTWMGGRSMFSGGPAAWFDFETYNAALRKMLGTTHYLEHFWSYPPHVMLFIWPLGLMPYLPAYIAWCAVGIALYLLACSSAIPRERMLFLAVAPGIAVCIFFGQNGFFGARLIHLPLGVAWAIQYAGSAFAVAAVVWTYWKRRDQNLSLALFVTATFLFSPYILNYDMVMFGFVVALLRDRADNTMRDHWLLLAVWSLPVTMMFAGAIWIPLAPVVLIMFACWLLRRLAQSDRSEVRALPEATVLASS